MDREPNNKSHRIGGWLLGANLVALVVWCVLQAMRDFGG